MDAAIRLSPDLPGLYINRAFIRYNSDDFFGAMSDYNYSLELEPKSTAALFNRALLRYEVKDLARAEDDLSAVLSLDPLNFHALYNRGLIRMEQEKNEEALEDFKAIHNKYPKFYPVYYAMAEVKRNMGDMRSAMQLAFQADDLVKKYVTNPEKNPLDRPAIAAAESNDSRHTSDENESEVDVMEKFNRLVTVSEVAETQLSYNEKIKGRVQDRNVQVEPEPSYAVSFAQGPASLKSVSNYFRELDDLNQMRLISRQFYLSPGLPAGSDNELSRQIFSFADDISQQIKSGKERPIDRLALGVAQTMLKNFPEAISNFDIAISLDQRFAVAYMARGFARYAQSQANAIINRNSENESFLDRRAQAAALQEAISDYDMAISLNPRLVFAWFNKGNIYYSAGDYTSAMQCFSEALKMTRNLGRHTSTEDLPTFSRATSRKHSPTCRKPENLAFYRATIF